MPSRVQFVPRSAPTSQTRTRNQRSTGGQRGNHDEIRPGRPEPSPESSPRVNDKPEEHAERQQDRTVDAEEVTQAIDHRDHRSTRRSA